MNEFKKGDRVVVKTSTKQFHGTIIGESRNGRWWNVMKDGTNYPQSFNKAFCQPERCPQATATPEE